MKRIIVFSLFVFLSAAGCFAKELSEKDLELVHRSLDLVLKAADYTKLNDKLLCLQNGAVKLQPEIDSKISEEAKLICNSIITCEEINEREADRQLKEGKKKKNKNIESDDKTTIMNLYNEFLEFEQTHEDLSSHFYFHKREAINTAMLFMGTMEQLKYVSSLINDYKKIAEMNPDYSENLMYLGSVYYLAPAIFGGNKKLGEEMLFHALETAKCKSEKVYALMAYSQVLFDKGRKEEAKELMKQAEQAAPGNQIVGLFIRMNDAGYSIMNADKYFEKNKKAK